MNSAKCWNLTDDFLGAFARLEDFSPLVASPEAKPKWN